jgi:hypothetical protein
LTGLKISIFSFVTNRLVQTTLVLVGAKKGLNSQWWLWVLLPGFLFRYIPLSKFLPLISAQPSSAHYRQPRELLVPTLITMLTSIMYDAYTHMYKKHSRVPDLQ